MASVQKIFGPFFKRHINHSVEFILLCVFCFGVKVKFEIFIVPLCVSKFSEQFSLRNSSKMASRRTAENPKKKKEITNNSMVFYCFSFFVKQKRVILAYFIWINHKTELIDFCFFLFAHFCLLLFLLYVRVEYFMFYFWLIEMIVFLFLDVFLLVSFVFLIWSILLSLVFCLLVELIVFCFFLHRVDWLLFLPFWSSWLFFCFVCYRVDWLAFIFSFLAQCFLVFFFIIELIGFCFLNWVEYSEQ